jgi:hypothetical protein
MSRHSIFIKVSSVVVAGLLFQFLANTVALGTNIEDLNLGSTEGSRLSTKSKTLTTFPVMNAIPTPKKGWIRPNMIFQRTPSIYVGDVMGRPTFIP